MTTQQELIERYREKTYIGDSVYVHFDGYHFVLETINDHPAFPGNTIALEPPVFDKLINYRKECYEQFHVIEKEGASL